MPDAGRAGRPTPGPCGQGAQRPTAPGSSLPGRSWWCRSGRCGGRRRRGSGGRRRGRRWWRRPEVRPDHRHQGADRRERPDQCRVGVAHFDAAVALWCPVGGADEAVQRVAAVEVAGVGDIGVVVGGAVDVGPLHFRVAHMLEDGVGAVGGVRARRPAVDRDGVLGRPVVPERQGLGDHFVHEDVDVGSRARLVVDDVVEQRGPHGGAGDPVHADVVLGLEGLDGGLGDLVHGALGPLRGELRRQIGPTPGEGARLVLGQVGIGGRRAAGGEGDRQVVELGQELLEPEGVARRDAERRPSARRAAWPRPSSAGRSSRRGWSPRPGRRG